jgi:undecaprenyl-diphosphatase
VTKRDDEPAGPIDPTLEAAPPEGWRRWVSDLGRYDMDRVAGFGAIIATGALLGVVLLALFAKIADEVLTRETTALDSAASEYLRRFSSPQMDVAARVISFMGSEAVFIFSAILLGLFLWQRRWGAAAMLVLISGGVQTLNSVLKNIFQRTRPLPVLGIISAQQYSFPSGHAMVSAAFYFYLAYLCWRLVHGVWRFILIAGLVLLVLLIGASRIYLEAHYLTDVIAGYLAGFVWADAVILGSQLLARHGVPRLRSYYRKQART